MIVAMPIETARDTEAYQRYISAKALRTLRDFSEEPSVKRLGFKSAVGQIWNDEAVIVTDQGVFIDFEEATGACYLPTPGEIERRAAEIRKQWTDTEKYSRFVTAFSREAAKRSGPVIDPKETAFARSLRKKRLDVGLSQKAVAKRLGVKGSEVSFIESGKRFPNPEMMQKLAAMYGVSVDELTKELRA